MLSTPRKKPKRCEPGCTPARLNGCQLGMTITPKNVSFLDKADNQAGLAHGRRSVNPDCALFLLRAH